MAVFSSSSSERSSEGGSRTPARNGGLTIIAPGVRLVGELASSGTVKVEGVIEGSVQAEQEVLVAKGGVVRGDIHAREAVVGGEVIGSVFASDRVEVQQGAVVQGDITTRKLIVQEGGEVNGHIRMGDLKAPSSPAS